MELNINCLNQKITEDYAIYQGDSIEIAKVFPDNSVGLIIFSPPFPELYTYSDSGRDLGNSQNYQEFFEHFKYLAIELKRMIKPGRCIVIHCIDVPIQKQNHGYIGLRDFPGDIIRLFESIGLIYHSRHIIWKDPLIEATRTKALGLMHKQIVKDSAVCRAGLPDYLITMRKHGENKEPIEHPNGLTEFEYFGSNPPKISGLKYQHVTWQKYASPVWMDIRQSKTLQKTSARDEKDEKHICPLQLDTIARGVLLWSNPGDIVYSPFMGIGSEVYQSVAMGRKGIGSELKESYYRQAELNLEHIVMENKQLSFNFLTKIN
jgi:DNA modification methylase